MAVHRLLCSRGLAALLMQLSPMVEWLSSLGWIMDTTSGLLEIEHWLCAYLIVFGLNMLGLPGHVRPFVRG